MTCSFSQETELFRVRTCSRAERVESAILCQVGNLVQCDHPDG